MFTWSFRLAVLIKLAAVCLAVIWIGNGTAAACGEEGEAACAAWKPGFRCDDKSLAPNRAGNCVKCGHRDGQPACEAMRRGPRCYRYMENIDGVCRARGGNNQQPYSGAGFDCKPGYNVQDGVCKPCGGAGQIECEAARPGPRCDDGLTSYRDICEAKGGAGQAPWPASRIGFRCEKGLAPSGSGDSETCEPCGEAEQPSCEKARAGKRCTGAYTQENDDGICEERGGNNQPAFVGLGFECREGYNWDRGLPGNRTCEPCGGFGQVTCEIMREGKICDEGLEQDHDWSLDRNRCFPSLMGETTDAAWDKVDEVGVELMEALLGDAFAVHDDSALTQSIADQDDTAADELSAATDGGVNPCVLDAFNAFSVGATAEANFIIGVGIEGGIAWDVTPEPRKPWKWYGSVSQSLQAGAGSSYGANLGCWTAENNALSGESVGLVIDIRDFIEKTHGVSTDLLSDVAGGRTATVLVGIWFNRDGDDLDGFAGITLSPVLGNGLNLLGATYVEAKTGQFGAAAPGGVLRPVALTTATLPDGKQLGYCKGACRVFADATPTPPEHQPLPMTFGSQGTETVSYSRSLSETTPASTEDFDVRGSWAYQVAGRTLVETVVEQRADRIVIQRAGSSDTLTYARTAANTYTNAAGRSFRFVTPDAGIWVPGDKSTSYQISRANE